MTEKKRLLIEKNDFTNRIIFYLKADYLPNYHLFENNDI